MFWCFVNNSDISNGMISDAFLSACYFIVYFHCGSSSNKYVVVEHNNCGLMYYTVYIKPNISLSLSLINNPSIPTVFPAVVDITAYHNIIITLSFV